MNVESPWPFRRDLQHGGVRGATRPRRGVRWIPKVQLQRLRRGHSGQRPGRRLRAGRRPPHGLQRAAAARAGAGPPGGTRQYSRLHPTSSNEFGFNWPQQNIATRLYTKPTSIMVSRGYDTERCRAGAFWQIHYGSASRGRLNRRR